MSSTDSGRFQIVFAKNRLCLSLVIFIFTFDFEWLLKLVMVTFLFLVAAMASFSYLPGSLIVASTIWFFLKGFGSGFVFTIPKSFSSSMSLKSCFFSNFFKFS